MPKKTGFEVLEIIREHSALATLPIIIFTSSPQDSDIKRAYQYGANAYLVKPSRPEELVNMVKAIKDFWLTHNH